MIFQKQLKKLQILLDIRYKLNDFSDVKISNVLCIHKTTQPFNVADF